MITLITGPMFCGKTTELIRRLTRAKIAGKNVILLRPAIDTRDHLTHSRLSHSIEEKFIDETEPLSSSELFSYDVIGIDEGQFFNDLKFLVETFTKWGKTVVIAGLNGTSEQKPFQPILDLIPIAEEIIKLNSVCMKCGSDYGTFTSYKGNDKDSDIKVGDEHEYEALCRICLDKKMIV